ncbi:hypothetical protein LG634_23360 [Streptomyces bambusae]|uniref:3-dehydroquinate synthase family protein n=1 Tax=Streptomyces bambusae TaxID=1550616 RepID=UPI001CFC6A5F|nr:hypothetical protein [Streptomyces bambusae]MCB5167757.1 hypothetical protein [Streptomyces bambusae]
MFPYDGPARAGHPAGHLAGHPAGPGTGPGPGIRIDRQLVAGPVHFPVQIRHGSAHSDELTRSLREFGPERIVLVTGPGLPRRAAARVLRQLGEAAPTSLLWPGPRAAAPPVPDGALVAALGGTCVLAAADRLRRADGTRPPVVRLPTTLRAMADTALTVTGGAPVLVRTDLEFLETLPPRALRAGLGLPVRTVLAVVPASAGQVAARLRTDGRYEPAALAGLLALCTEARSVLVRYDPLEQGPAAALHYGDALARALCSSAPVPMPYGEALALGLRVAARAARLAGLLPEAGEALHTDLLDRAGAVRFLPPGADPDAAVRILTAGREHAGLVLLDRPGEPHVHRGALATPVAAGLLAAALRAVVAAPQVPAPAGPPVPLAAAGTGGGPAPHAAGAPGAAWWITEAVPAVRTARPEHEWER